MAVSDEEITADRSEGYRFVFQRAAVFGMLVGLVMILGSITLISSGSVKTVASRAKVSC
jgi:hypothetical protein